MNAGYVARTFFFLYVEKDLLIAQLLIQFNFRLASTLPVVWVETPLWFISLLGYKFSGMFSNTNDLK